MNSPVTGEFPAQRASNAENVDIWWRHHAMAADDLPTSLGYSLYKIKGSWFVPHENGFGVPAPYEYEEI